VTVARIGPSISIVIVLYYIFKLDSDVCRLQIIDQPWISLFYGEIFFHTFAGAHFTFPCSTPNSWILHSRKGRFVDESMGMLYPHNFDLMEPGWNTSTLNVVLTRSKREGCPTKPSRTRTGRWTFFPLCSSFWRSPTFGLTQRVPPQLAPPILLHKSCLVTIVAIVKTIGVCSVSSGVASPPCSHVLG